MSWLLPGPSGKGSQIVHVLFNQQLWQEVDAAAATCAGKGGCKQAL